MAKVVANVTIADGMIREFEIANQHGVICIPIGATGYAAAVLADRLIGDGANGDTTLLDGLKELRESRENLNELINAAAAFVAENDVWVVGFLTDEEMEKFDLGADNVSVYVPQSYHWAGTC